MAKTRENSKLKGVQLPDSLKISGDLDCLKGAELVVLRHAVLRRAGDGERRSPHT